MPKIYTVNEIFYAPQGEGVRAGTMNIFVRFTGCNLRCAHEPGPRSPGGFDCDTEFVSGRRMDADEIFAFCHGLAPQCRAIIFTGGEPTLQLDSSLTFYFGQKGYHLAIETNGSRPVPEGLHWVTVSPKVAEHAIKQTEADEVKYVRAWGQAIPRTSVRATHYLISPAFEGGELDRRNLEWAIKLCRENPQWRLSVQQHKGWAVR